MKFKIVFLTTLLLAVKSYAQPKNEINLPEGGKDIEIKHITSLYSLYITQNQEVYNDDKRLEYFQDINYSFLNQLSKKPPLKTEALIFRLTPKGH